MPRQSQETRLEAAMRAKAALDAEIKQLQVQERERKRAEDDRRFMVLGRNLMAHLDAEPASTLSREVAAMLDRNLTRESERALFTFLAAPAEKPASRPRTKASAPRSADA